MRESLISWMSFVLVTVAAFGVGGFLVELEDLGKVLNALDGVTDALDDDVGLKGVETLPIYNDDKETRRLLKQANPNYGPVRSGVGSGYLRMKAGQVVTIRSSNFGTGTYFNNEAYVWRFFGHQCILSAQCPCSSIPLSQGCLNDYLKISDTFLFNQRFCGELKPEGSYQSATNNLKIKFRSDWKETDSGFLCYVSCAAPGQAEFVVPSNVTCPGGTNTTTTLLPGATTTFSSTAVIPTAPVGPNETNTVANSYD